MNMGRIDATMVKDTVEIWRVINNDGMPHSFHVHDVQFQVLRVDGDSPPPRLRGWKDTLLLPSNVDFEIAVPFSDYADPAAPYMFHCHILLHEDSGMMGQFVVVEPGQQAITPRVGGGTGHHDHHQGGG